MTMPGNNQHGFSFNRRNGQGAFEEHSERMRMFHRFHTGDKLAEEAGPNRLMGHNERMQEFRNSHSDELRVWVSRRDLRNTMRPLLVAGAVGEAGGLKLPISAAEWTALAPLRTVATHRFSAN